MAGFMTFTITPDDGEPYTIEATSRDVLKWEKSTKGASMHTFRDNLMMAHMYKLAWVTATRLGRTTASLAEWETLVDVDVEDESEDGAGELDPTRTGRGPGNSSP